MTVLIICAILIWIALIVINAIEEDNTSTRITASAVLGFFLIFLGIAIALVGEEEVTVKSYDIEQVVKQSTKDGAVVSSDTTYVIRFER
jgi:hypothetical protein